MAIKMFQERRDNLKDIRNNAEVRHELKLYLNIVQPDYYDTIVT